MKFSTFDNDQDIHQEDRNCAEYYTSGWWFKDCYNVNLNARYLESDHVYVKDPEGITWSYFKGYKNSLKTVIMKLRRHN